MLDEKKLVLGTAQFGLKYGKFARQEAQQQEEIQKVLTLCQDYGVFQIDTAPIYGDFFSKNINLHDFSVDTKVFFDDLDDIRPPFFAAIESTLSSLSARRINTLYLHNPTLLGEDSWAINQVALMFREAKKRNLITNAGISTYNIREIKPLIEKLDIDIIQMPINYIDGYFREDYEYLKKLKKKRNFLIYARSIFLQGILINLEKIPKSMQIHTNFLNEVKSWLDKNQIDPICACVSFVEKNDIVDKYIIGVQNTSEFQQVIDTVTIDIPIAEYPCTKNQGLLDPRIW